MMTSEQLYRAYRTKMQKIADVKYSSAVLQWDQETYMPPRGADFRGRQIATLNETAHSLFTDEETGRLLDELSSRNDLGENEKMNVRRSREDYAKATRLPSAFVRELSVAVNNSFHAWLAARKENSFRLFEKPLGRVVELKRKQTELLGYSAHPYDALMDEFDKGLTVDYTDRLFHQLKPALASLLQKSLPLLQPESDYLSGFYPKDKQWQLGLELLKRIHFDFKAGRQDISEHPFTINFSPDDVRVTTRIDENDLSNMLWSCLHEGGHALYEQGLPASEYGLPLGEYCSLSIHESQSRLWENCIGRNLPFWTFNYPLLQQTFPGQLGKVNLDHFCKAINKITPSLIRTEADEITYHFHVIIRYELEKELIRGSLKTEDIPAWWGENYRSLLNLEVPDDLTGCLQDVHWSHGSFGYFATYSLGSLYAAQFYAAILRQVPGAEEKIAMGDNSLIHSWLKENIYSKGKFHTSAELCKQATGHELNSSYFIDYVSVKLNKTYGL